MKNFSFTILLLFICFALQAQLTQYVNPFIGTGAHGHTYPGATVPFGMVQLSPDTRPDGYNDWDGCSGYHHSDSIIYGFSHTHLSGTGIADYCDVLLMPDIGDPANAFKNKMNGNKGYPSKFNHKNEKASPGFYSVLLDDKKIQVELTATARVGMHKYIFPATDKANIILDLTHRDKLLEGSYIKIISPTKIEGLRRSSSWAADQWLYFAIEFSEPFDKSFSADSAHHAMAFHFAKSAKAKTVFVKCALSAVSTEGAWKNMQAETEYRDFEKVKQDTKAAWEKQLSKIEVAGGSADDKINFYTALYHTMIVPNLYNDADGSYRGRDNQIHHTQNAADYYTVFSLWDTYRAAHPLYTILEQKRTTDFINTFLLQYEQGGRLPVWELSANETNCMIGYHSVSVIADAMVKGIGGFDYMKAFKAAKDAQTLTHQSYRILYDQVFFESNDESESVSKTLEYAYDDWCIAQIAQLAGSDEYNNYNVLSKKWMNLFDGEFIRPRTNGGWYEPFDPAEVNFNYTEANAWQYNFYAPQDLGNLFPPERMANNQKRLDNLFTASSQLTGRQQSDITGLLGQYAHGNEPSHHVAYLYNYVNATEKTQYFVNKIRTDFYKNSPEGLSGNEDCGQMSAWYVFSAMGFYPVCPGKTFYDAGTPLFDTVKIHLENGNTTTIIAKNKTQDAIYVRSLKVNNTEQISPVIQHADIVNGATIVFNMTSDSTQTMAGAVPEKIFSDVPLCPIISGQAVFTDSTLVTITPFDSSNIIVYSTKGEIPLVSAKVYKGPFYISGNSVVTATAKTKSGNAGKMSMRVFKKISDNIKLQYVAPYNHQYSGGGNFALLDGTRGNTDFRTGSWQGWWGNDMEVILDLGGSKPVKAVSAGFLQDVKSWIWMPETVTVEISDDGVNFTQAAVIKNTEPADSYTQIVKDFSATFTQTHAKYIRIKAKNKNTIPTWHTGAGEKAWIFCDEIIIE